MTLDWNPPASTGGDSIQIIEYKVFVALQNAAGFEQVCDGSDQTVIDTT